MDISSKYFRQLKQPGLNWVGCLWGFLADIYLVGKSRELISFLLWEVTHKSRFYYFRNQYVRFKKNTFISLTDEGVTKTPDTISSSFLAEQGIQLTPISIDWRFCTYTTDGLILGSLYSHPNKLFFSKDNSRAISLFHEFEHPITSIFICQRNFIFVCSAGIVYKSNCYEKSFEIVLRLSTPISYFLFNNGITELPDQKLIIGEYGSIWHGKTWQNLAFLYYSSDGGNTWSTSDFLMDQGVNKHIHLVKYCAHLKAVLLTDGDNKKQVWVNSNLMHFGQKIKKRRMAVNKQISPPDGWLHVNGRSK